MVSGRTTTGHNLIVAHPPAMLASPACAVRAAARSATRPESRPTDPLYPEPSGDRRWIAEEPLPWLGPRPLSGSSKSLTDLVADRTVPEEAANLLSALVRDRASVLIIAGRARAGKSTLLEALLPYYPLENRRIRLRGSFETFAWETDARFDPPHAILIAEEISGHLPTYLWGPLVGRFLSWRDYGAALIATAHGESVADIARLLAGYPLRLPLRSVAAFDVIVHLGPSSDDHSGRSVLTDVWAIGLTPGGGLTHRSLFDRSSICRDVAGDSSGQHPGCPGHAVNDSSAAQTARIGSS